MFRVIGNIYLGEGFTWVEDISIKGYNDDLWKYSKHGIYETKEEALRVSEELNKKYYRE